MKLPIPLLIFSDAVSSPSGLARITRDLATRIHANLSDVFRVATIGYGGAGSSQYPWTQYSWTMNDQFIIRDLPEVWKDFAGDQRGIFMSIYDPHRMLWLARPEACTDARVKRFLEKPPFSKWGYFPIDASGPNDKLSHTLGHCLLGYNRILCYSEWARKIVANTLHGKSEVNNLDQLPHGIDTSVFFPRPRARQRQMFGQMTVGVQVPIPDDEFLIGIVATNQSRKDWGLGLSVCSELAKTRKIRIWMHTDVMDRHWSLPYLLSDLNLNGGNFISQGCFTDDTLAKLYSACDITLGIGAGEGFGYPIFESIACGTPCVHGDYGGAAEHVPDLWRVPPAAWRYEGVYGCKRPVFRPEDWEKTILSLSRNYELSPNLDWNNLWPRWEAWFRKGAE